jgi:hypothetical protein
MKITIDDRILSKYDLTIEELLILMLSKNHSNIPQIVKSLVDKDIGIADPKNPNIVLFRQKEDSLLKDIFLESDKIVISKADRYELLAAQLRDLYPQGKKAGTSYMWRDSNSLIAKRLKSLVSKYGDCFTDEQAINATKNYVESFNGDYRYMQLLKYFILKKVNNNGEIEESSQLLSYIENEGQIESNNDWTAELR